MTNNMDCIQDYTNLVLRVMNYTTVRNKDGYKNLKGFLLPNFAFKFLAALTLLLLFTRTGFSQQLTIEFSPSTGSSEYETLTVSSLPQLASPYSEGDADYTVQYVLSSIKTLSGEWLLEKSGELTAEENFAKQWFMTALKNPNDIQGMKELVGDEYFRVISERHAAGDYPNEFELTESEKYSDIRLLGLARYGFQRLLFADLKPIGGGEASGIMLVAGVSNGGYHLIGTWDNGTVTLLFGYVPLEIRKSLRNRIGIQ